MTREDKELLIRDLCGRLPYQVRMFEIEPINDIQSHLTLYSISNKESVMCITPSGGIIGSSVDAFKPYLFPLSSMTEEQKKEEYEICKYYLNGYETKLIDFYHKNHLDHRGLIPMGLAIDATGLGIYL